MVKGHISRLAQVTYIVHLLKHIRLLVCCSYLQSCIQWCCAHSCYLSNTWTESQNIRMLLMPSSASVTCVKFHSPFHTECDNSLDITCQWVLKYIFSYLNWWCHDNIHNVTPPSLRRVEHVACYLDCPPASSGWVPVAVCARRWSNHYWTQGRYTEQTQATDYTQLHWRQTGKIPVSHPSWMVGFF